MKFNNIKIYIMTIVGATIILGYNSRTQTEVEKVGYLVTLSKNEIYYKCGNKEEILNKNGKFSCSSFPVGFYKDSTKIGSITSLHNDGFVFPQDIEYEDVDSTVMKIASR